MFDRQTADGTAMNTAAWGRTGPPGCCWKWSDRRGRGMTILDVGGGIGVIDQELLKAGAEPRRPVDVVAGLPGGRARGRPRPI